MTTIRSTPAEDITGYGATYSEDQFQELALSPIEKTFTVRVICALMGDGCVAHFCKLNFPVSASWGAEVEEKLAAEASVGLREAEKEFVYQVLECGVPGKKWCLLESEKEWKGLKKVAMGPRNEVEVEVWDVSFFLPLSACEYVKTEK